MNYTTLIYEVKNHIGYITLNRPEVMNAISYQMTREILDVCDQARRDPAVRVVILTGAREKAFGTGLDLKERAQDTDETTVFDKHRERNLPGVHSHHQA